MIDKYQFAHNTWWICLQMMFNNVKKSKFANLFEKSLIFYFLQKFIKFASETKAVCTTNINGIYIEFSRLDTK